MFLRMALALAIGAGATGLAMAAEDEPVAAAAAASGVYYSETKAIVCANAPFCVAAFAKVPKGKTLTATHASCVVGTTTPLFAAILTRSESKTSIPVDEALVVLERQPSATANGSTLTGVNQAIVYRVKSGLFPVVTAQTAAVGTIQLQCILSGTLQ